MEPTPSSHLATVEAITFIAGIAVAFIFPPAAVPVFAVTWLYWRKRRRAEKAAKRAAAA